MVAGSTAVARLRESVKVPSAFHADMDIITIVHAEYEVK